MAEITTMTKIAIVRIWRRYTAVTSCYICIFILFGTATIFDFRVTTRRERERYIICNMFTCDIDRTPMWYIILLCFVEIVMISYIYALRVSFELRFKSAKLDHHVYHHNMCLATRPLKGRLKSKIISWETIHILEISNRLYTHLMTNERIMY